MPILPPSLPGQMPIEITLRRSARARRFSLRVSRLDGRVTLSIPTRAREADALAFARAQEAWLRRALIAVPPEDLPAFGGSLPVEGVARRLLPGTGRAPKLEAEALLVPGDPAQLGRRLAAFLKTLARDRLAAASDHYATLLGRPYTSLSLRDTRSRWGSCTHDGRLMYSWRLIMAPPQVLDYVCAHEVAHLAQMNHSPAFWAEVARLMPDYEVPRRWLKAKGQALHAIRFDSASN
ncbi:M48 family metallopeptidase [Gemmobacter serpentinus]|uniref:M48 family metallopeptidase n=1 Tax=Gemmobacter serpentinus TaxID=2652247 RepID=UPI00124C3057|nr:SprT family zinc-dependent metalloprotease [Gemmobacter serpentinus]